MGRVTPIFCELVPSKSSVRINPRMGLQFMPMVFPVQTRMKARIAFFKYPLRALWLGYRDFVGNFRQDLEEPYIDISTTAKLKAMASTGSLGDYLGLPTTLFGEYGQGGESSVSMYKLACLGNKAGGDPDFTYFKNLPILNSSMFDAFISEYGASTPAASNFNLNLPAPASASSSNSLYLGMSFVRLEDVDNTFNDSKRFKLYYKFSDEKKPSDELINSLSTKLCMFCSKDSDDVRYDWNLVSCVWSAQKNILK